jgi:hypothetical protein
MSDTEVLMQEIKTLPPDYVAEVLKFIDHLKQGESPTPRHSSPLLPPAYSPREALRVAAEKAADPNRKPVSYYRGCLKDSKTFAGDPVDFQRKIRAEWDRE